MDEAVEAGVLLRNVAGGADKRSILETTGAGACFLDYDADGDVDLYLVNGATIDTVWSEAAARDALYRNDGGGRFTDVTAEAGIAERGWGGGCAVGDYDNDGDPDLYLTHFGPNVLLRNDGKGRFSDATSSAGVAGGGWSLGAAFLDVEGDGDLDLYVARYLHLASTDAAAGAGCTWKGIPVMCGPRGFPGETDRLYRNEGDGTFSDVSAAAGVTGSALFGMGVVAGDVDADGDADLFVANDSQDNHLFFNDGGGRFTDGALGAGVALSGDGRQQASMGADLGDYDNDGDEDLFVTNFSDDYHTLYRNEGHGLFVDVTAAAGLDAGARSTLGWGGGFFDFDNDGDLDLFLAAGHVYPQVDGRDPVTSYRQQNRLFRNEANGTFVDVSNTSGPGLLQARSSRGAAFGDYDDDGDLDVVVINENDVPTLLRNDGGDAGHWLKVRLRGARSNRDGIGARIRVEAGERPQFREVRLSAGYCSSHDARVHFGLGRAAAVRRLEVRWPSGKTQVLSDLPADRLVTVDEDRGLVSADVLPGARGVARSARRPATTAPAASATIARTDDASVPAPSGRTLSEAGLRDAEALAEVGTQRILAGDYAPGIAALEEAIRRLPSGEPGTWRSLLASLYDNLGVARMRAERLDECAAPIERAIALAPRAKSHQNLGLCHFHARRYAPAIAALRAARAAGGAGGSLSYDLGRALASAGRCREALDELQLALDRLPPVDPEGRRGEAWYQKGGCLANEGRPAEAAQAFRETLRTVPGHQKALYKLGLVLRVQGDVAAAERMQSLFQARQPADEVVRALKRSGPRTPKERLEVARTFRGAGLPAEALTEVQKVLAADPGNAGAPVLAAELYLALRPPGLEAAERSFQAALRATPAEPDALAGLAEVRRRQGRGPEARRLFEQALTVRPGHAAAEVGLARLALDEGRPAEAAAAIEKLRQGRPDEAELLLALADVYASAPAGPLRRPEEALQLLDRARCLYGEDVAIRLRALAAANRPAEAAALAANSPFAAPD